MKEVIIRYKEEKAEGHSIVETVGELIRCKHCIHKPTITGDEGNGFDFEFPDERCPCQCDDPWYNWMPADDWFCGNGERGE